MGEHDEHRIAPAVRGWLESPATDAIAPGCVVVSGWAFATGSSIVSVQVTGLGAPRPLRFGLRRDDVARVYPDEPTAERSGFTGYLEFDSGPADRVQFEVWATLGDGRSLRLFERRLAPLADAWESSKIRFAARQAIRHPRVLLSGRSWRNALRWILEAPSPESAQSGQPIDADLAREQTTRAFLGSFLAAGSRIALATSPAPVVSIVIVVWNRADLTLTCLRALAAHRDAATEVIVVDNASTDETAELLAHVDGVRAIRNESNLGFTVSANLGAAVARGEFLLFLNNDAELVPGSLTHLTNTIRRASTIGAVGGKLVFPDGRLQEAGSIVWSDGSCDAYGRGGDPTAPEYNFEREVDFCSGALLLTPRPVFERLGGFDERYRPAYYEDADYCARLWTAGYAVVYQPKAGAIHYEFGSAISRETSIDLQRERQPMFVASHTQWLSSQPSRDRGALAARSHPHGRPSVIVIDDAVPDPRMGAGFPRAAALVDALAELGYLITIYATGVGGEPPPTSDRLAAVEVVAGGPAGLRTFLSSRQHHYDLAIVSRPHNMQYVKAAVGPDLSALGVPCVYDAEAVFALREIGRRRTIGLPLSDGETQALIDAERNLTRGCAAVLAVSEAERRLLAAADARNVVVVSHAIDAQPTPSAFDRRHTILFVGAFGADSPNDDAALFFCRDVLPALRTAVGCNAPVVVGGARIPEHLSGRADAGVSWHSDVADLAPLYDNARVFVAPTRYAAGIPLKVIEAAARGVPIVCTPLLADQLGWDAGVELLTGESPLEFARAIASVYADPERWLRLREAAVKRVARDYSPTAFRSALETALKVSGIFSAAPTRSRQQD